MTELVVIGILVALFVLFVLIASVYTWNKPPPTPEEPLPWSRWDVVLYVCMGLCSLGGFLVPTLPGMDPTPETHTLTERITTHMAAFAPFFMVYTVFEMRHYRRHETERARRETTEANSGKR